MKTNHTKKMKGEASEKQNLDSICTWDATDGASNYMKNNRFDDIFSGIVSKINNWRMLE